MDLESLETDSVRSRAESSRNLLNLSQRIRQPKNKLACGVVALVCFAGVAISFGFLFVQRSEFVQEKVHFSEVDASREIGQAGAQAQQQRSIVFNLPLVQNRGSRSPSNINQNRANTSSQDNQNPVGPAPASRNSTSKRLPDNAQSKHPVSLLYEMKLAPVFESFNCNNTMLRHHPFFKVVLSISGKSESFSGYGTKKKIAKKIAAQQACTSLYNLTYSDPPNLDLEDDAERCGF